MSQICLDNGIIICSDEIHSDLVYSGHKHVPIATLSDDVADITITLLSASKTFNIAGLKSSAVVITNPYLREKFLTGSRGFSGAVNILGETAMRTAYENCEDWLDHMLQYLEVNRNLLFDFVISELPSIQMNKPEATFLGWLDFTEVDLSDPGKFFLDHARVALNSGSWFGNEYANFVRLNFGCPKERLLIGLERIKKSLNNR
jgi:cystathionine beta-lyase